MYYFQCVLTVSFLNLLMLLFFFKKHYILYYTVNWSAYSVFQSSQEAEEVKLWPEQKVCRRMFVDCALFVLVHWCAPSWWLSTKRLPGWLCLYFDLLVEINVKGACVCQSKKKKTTKKKPLEIKQRCKHTWKSYNQFSIQELKILENVKRENKLTEHMF